MLLSKQLVQSALEAPPGHQHMKTSRLLDTGLLTWPSYPGLPTYTPIGADLIERVEAEVRGAARRRGYDEVRFPAIMSDEDLGSGEEVGEQFRSKVIPFDGLLAGHHLLTTPEMFIGCADDVISLSHRSLPIRISYTADIFRQVSDTFSFLRCRQFRVVGFIVLHADGSTAREHLQEMVDITIEGMDRIGVPGETIWADDPVHAEVAYPCSEGDIVMDGPQGRSRGLSVGVGAHYTSKAPLPLRYHTARNERSPVSITSYAVCTNRLMYASFDANRGERGFELNERMRPFDVVVVPESAVDQDAALGLMTLLRDRGGRVAVDDRWSMRSSKRVSFAGFIGAPVAVAVADGVASPTWFADAATQPDVDGTLAAVVRVLGLELARPR